MSKKMTDEEALLKKHISKHHLKATKERGAVLKAFMEVERHITADELYIHMKENGSSIGLATIYRSLNLFCESGLAEQRQFGDGHARYELTYNVRHHDHLICKQCNRIIEFENSEIEKLQEEVARKHHFTIFNHRLELYGTCGDCSGKSPKEVK